MATTNFTTDASNAVREAFSKLTPTKPFQPKTHDYTSRGWGHDFNILRVIDDGKRLRASGWGRGIAQGDYLVLPNESRTTRYEVTKIDYMRDPTDQWFADLAFAPREGV